MKKIGCLIVLLLAVHIASYGQNSNNNDVYNKRFQLQNDIEAGDKNALNVLGVSYLQDYPTDYGKAFILFQRAYNEGVEYAAFNLGHCYYHGYGVIKNYATAYKLFLEDNGKTSGALYYLGAMYFNGYGVSVDYNKSFDYFQKAKARGYAASDIFLGICYAEGKGVEKNESRALSFLLPHAYNNNSEAQFYVANIYMNQGNNEEALFWYGKIVKKYITVSVIIGDIYKSENNISKAKQYYQQASDYGVAIGEYKLGDLIYAEAIKLECNGFDSDAKIKYKEAFKLFKDAAEDNSRPIPAAMRKLQACYRYGRGTEVDMSLAEKWKHEAIKHKDDETIELLKLEIRNNQ